MSIFNVFSLMWGLALFIYGMDIMGKALEKAAGSKLSAILSTMTSSPIRGFLLGLGVTAVIQSSSATAVMVVGFVNSGIITLKQAMTTEDNYEVSKMLHVINDFERISDYSVNVAVAAREMVEKGITFSKESYAPHESSRSYRKDKHSEYQEFYNEYRKKYKITNIW